MIKLSASSMKTFTGCPKKYQFQYLLKPDVPPTDWSFLELGKCAHRTLELFHEHFMVNPHEKSTYSKVMTKCFKIAYKEHDAKILKNCAKELTDMLQDYLNMLKVSEMPNVIHNEMAFNFKVGEFLVRGYIDRIDRISDGVYHIVDYKTNKNPKYLDKFQLLIYGLAVMKAYPDAKTIKGSYSLLRFNGELKSWNFIQRDFDKVRDKISKIGTHIDLGDNWVKKPTRLCDWCNFQNICENQLMSEDDIFE